MSVKHMAWVWEHSRAEGGTLLVALALADSVNHVGGSHECWPRQAVLAEMTRLSERQVQRAVAELESLGEIEKQREGSRGNVYRFLKVDDPTYCRPTPTSGPPDTDVVSSPVTHDGSYVEPEVRTGKEPEGGAVQASLMPEPADELFARWQRVFDRYDAKLTPARRKAAQKALREEPNLDVLEQAMRGFKVYRQRKPGGIELGDIFGTHPGSSDLRSKIEWARTLAPGETANGPTTLRSLIGHVPSDRQWIIEHNGESAANAITHGRRDESSEAFVRQHAKAEPVIGENGRFVGWRKVDG